MNYDPSYLISDEPDPEPNDLPPVWDLVIEDMKARDQHGLEHYGTRLQPFNGRKNLVDLYQELLDSTVYARAEIYEREQPCVWAYNGDAEWDTECNWTFSSLYIPDAWRYCPVCGKWLKKEE